MTDCFPVISQTPNISMEVYMFFFLFWELIAYLLIIYFILLEKLV